ncbi:MAG TPA: hypothetical protein DIU39_06550 [Flavobacteriales bacterium]|nr:hypothetical protein [Flavobacteriales bacterium]|tara:strand:+ start:26409 stop:27128 length:720 start_codon:yes stop_codon:yes gene_type:complete
MFKDVNLLHKLEEIQQKNPVEDLTELLNNDSQKEQDALNRVFSGNNSNQNFDLNTIKQLFPESKIYNIEQIKKLCIDYRLRFLDAKLFKDELPQEALNTIRRIENKTGLRFENFKIIAPAALFKLKDPDKDPILFADLGNNNYLFIHKWGNDMKWYRKWVMWPFRKIENLLKLIVAFNAAAVYLMPDSWFIYGSPEAVPTHKMFLFLFMLIGTLSLSIFYGVAIDKNFTESEWDNHYLR